MKYFIISLIGIFTMVLNSCDNRKKFIADGVPDPTITITGAKLDSVKLSLKSGKDGSVCPLQIGGINTQKTLSYDFIVGNGKVSINSKLALENEKVMVSNGFNKVELYVSELGTNLIMFSLKDEFDKITSLEYKVYAFENLPPVAVFSKTNVVSKAILSPYEYTIDASNSFDKDARYGGYIKSYDYYINDVKIATSASSKRDWIFSGSGNYNIKIVVTDNDGSTSSASDIIRIN